MSCTFSRKSSGLMAWRIISPFSVVPYSQIELLLQLARLLARQRQQLRHIGRHLDVDLREQVGVVRIERVVEVEDPVGDMGETYRIGLGGHALVCLRVRLRHARLMDIARSRSDASTKIVTTGERGPSALPVNVAAGKGDVMRSILLKSSLVAIGSVAASLSIVSLLVPALGGVVDGNAWLMSIVCPLAIGWPASAYTFWQSARLRRAHARSCRRPRRACRGASQPLREGEPRPDDRPAQPRELLRRARRLAPQERSRRAADHRRRPLQEDQ